MPFSEPQNFRFIVIYAGDLMPEFGKAGPTHKSNVTCPYDRYFHLITLTS
ncbi:hypothetical protein SBDP1_1160016 [Syntrophobacter sp. SbD1]|nr:hypothetical protein SBDP1_1160016 [Syntrophobacter sp. SbD1]